MRDREFIISFPYDSLRKKGGLSKIDKAYQELGYTPMPSDEPDKLCYEKGKKIATYLGSINLDWIYRRVVVELTNDDTKVLIHYYFSWLTNIGRLLSTSAPELKALQNKIGIKSIKVERNR
jgi:hypothetical protein